MGGGTYVSSSLAYFNHGDFHKEFFPDITYASIDYENALEEVIKYSRRRLVLSINSQFVRDIWK